MDNSLTHFFSLLNGKSETHIKDLLGLYRNDKEIFLHLYNSIPTEFKPDLTKKSNEEILHSLYYAISSLNDDDFNKVFFKDLKGLMNNKWLKQSLYARKDNKKLQEFLETEDKPLNRSQLIDKLKSYHYIDNEKYYRLIELHKKDLVFINNIKIGEIAKDKKSVVLENLFNWFTVVKNKNNMLEVIKLADEIGYSFSDKNVSYRHRIDFNYNTEISNEDLEGFNILFQRNPTVNKYDLLASITTLMFSPIDKIKAAITYNKRAGLFLWEIFEDHMITTLKNDKDKYINIENKDSFEILKELYFKTAIAKQFNINHIYTKEDPTKEFKDLIYQTRVNVLDDELSKNEAKTKKMKI